MIFTGYSTKLVQKYNWAESILSLGCPVLAASVQLYLYCKCKTTKLKICINLSNIVLVFQNKSIVTENTISAFPVIFKIPFTNIMLHCSPRYMLFHRANLYITWKIISFCMKNIFLFQLISCCGLLLVATFALKSQFGFPWSTKANEVVFR